MKNLKKSYQNLNFNKVYDFLDKKVFLYGFVHHIISLKNVIFLTLRYENYLIQATIKDKNLFSKEISLESVVLVHGILTKKPSKKDYQFSDLEIVTDDICLLSKAKQLPILINSNDKIHEELELKYRYLYLRRKEINEIMLFRSKFIFEVRKFFVQNGFFEHETPLISVPTLNGANDFLISCDLNSDKYFALPQSPQTWKQLLMFSGFTKYFQIAKCFRNEDSRSDRQIEFSQLDIEIAFTSEKEIVNLINKFLKFIFKKFLNYSNFKIESLTFKKALFLYGSDKPDLRYDFKIIDFFPYLNQKAIGFLIDIEINSKQFAKIKEEVHKFFQNDYFFLYFENQKVVTNYQNFFNLDQKKAAFLFKVKSPLAIFILNNNQDTRNILGLFRQTLIKNLNFLKKVPYAFVWIKKWPMFYYNKLEKTYCCFHHPFTKTKLEKNILKSKSEAYDIVINGYEIGGGSLRNNDVKLQKEIFKILGISDAEIDYYFGYFMEAMNYGCPPHGGIALGIERLLMVILNESSIKNVILFPKTSKKDCLLTDSPLKIK
ncbi:aspartate--tRNA ligase [symbiont of Argiope bruennichi]|uniref:aspartate--tRNA ligase n=1 Tax=symbiont of Argiope bruennichi TaxID=2810479 RepID=UPI003DA284A7